MAYIDFQEVKRRVTIHQAAQQLGLMLKAEKNQFRGICPSCNSGGDRALVITPDRGLFYCFAAKSGGDCLQLVHHITGIPLQEAAEFLLPQEDEITRPRKSEAETRTSLTSASSAAPLARQKSEGFDPQKFLARLEYTPEVAALGLSEEEASGLGIGATRNKLYVALRWENGDVAVFAEWENGQLRLPKNAKLLPRTSNVVQLKRPA